MKKRKILCIVTLAILSVLYVEFALAESFFGLMLLLMQMSFVQGALSFAGLLLTIAAVLFLLAPLISVAGIIISIVQLKRDRLGAAFLVQLLPVFTTVHASLLFLISIIFGKG